MKTNRSMPPSVVIPELPYPDVREAVEWLCRSFGFVERLQIGNHRAQLVFGNASVIVTQRGKTDFKTSLLVRVDDVDVHFERTKQAGAQISNPPTDYPYRERQYVAEDLGGHHWTFSQTIADIDPQTWGGKLFEQT